jgi:hypothetical protein
MSPSLYGGLLCLKDLSRGATCLESLTMDLYHLGRSSGSISYEQTHVAHPPHQSPNCPVSVTQYSVPPQSFALSLVPAGPLPVQAYL